MGSKGTRYIALPVYVVNIGLLYALLLTSGLMLAWVTIYRHEKSISELKQLLKIKQTTYDLKQFSAAVGKRDDQEGLYEDVNSAVEKFLADDSSERSRRQLDSSQQENENTDSRRYLKGEKGEKGTKGRKGRRGKSGNPGKNGSQGEKGEIGKDGRDGRIGRPGQTGQDGIKGQKGDTHGIGGLRGSQGLPGLPGHQGEKGASGQKGAGGQKGPKGEGEKGDTGDRGDTGRSGIKGDKGEHGVSGAKGSKGDHGREGKTIMHSESAHIVGSGGKIKSAAVIHPTASWKPKHLSGSMAYKSGYLSVGVGGFYFIYSQMFYYDGSSAHIMGYNVYIDEHKILKAVYSVPSKTKKFQTQYTGGVFKVRKGQKISVGTPFTKYYYYNETLSFFGAFMLHR